MFHCFHKYSAHCFLRSFNFVLCIVLYTLWLCFSTLPADSCCLSCKLICAFLILRVYFCSWLLCTCCSPLEHLVIEFVVIVCSFFRCRNIGFRKWSGLKIRVIRALQIANFLCFLHRLGRSPLPGFSSYTVWRYTLSCWIVFVCRSVLLRSPLVFKFLIVLVLVHISVHWQFVLFLLFCKILFRAFAFAMGRSDLAVCLLDVWVPALVCTLRMLHMLSPNWSCFSLS